MNQAVSEAYARKCEPSAPFATSSDAEQPPRSPGLGSAATLAAAARDLLRAGLAADALPLVERLVMALEAAANAETRAVADGAIQRALRG